MIGYLAACGFEFPRPKGVRPHVGEILPRESPFCEGEATDSSHSGMTAYLERAGEAGLLRGEFFLDNRIEALFHEAADLAPGKRSAFLEERCRSEPELKSRVDKLLKCLDRGDSLTPPILAWDSESEKEFAEGAGSMIDRYRLVRPLGEGGFGVVYQAEQEAPVVRPVALKIIKLGMDTKQVVARFEAERQALALMDHPHIAKVLDGGTTELGRPYFVMELVAGVPITEYCDQHRLSTRERLELFIQVCQAVQHAHQKGIIHRDLKPSNVLVTVHDGEPAPKVIDFGVAKAIHRRLTEKTVFTEYRQLIGTPVYMSPEQAEVTTLDVDTRTDIYSLGVLLYELLTGTTPFDLKTLERAGYLEMQRVIREEEPVKPSTRLSTLGKNLSNVASRRRTEAPVLTRLVRGDLDWIVMKSLEKDRTRRYATASSLADDVGRYLRNEPVHAGPPTTSYRFQKFLRRNRTVVLSGVLVALALVVGTVGAILGMIEAADERDEAEKERKAALAARRDAVMEAERAQAVTRFLTETLSLADPEVSLSPDLSVRTILDRAAADVERAFTGQPEAEAMIRTTIGRAYASLGEDHLADTHLRRAVALLDGLDEVRSLDFYRTLWKLTDVAFKLERDDTWSLARRARRVGHDLIGEVDKELADTLTRFTGAVEDGDVSGADILFDAAVRQADSSLRAGDARWLIFADTLSAGRLDPLVLAGGARLATLLRQSPRGAATRASAHASGDRCHVESVGWSP